jgi:hypothetical protein
MVRRCRLPFGTRWSRWLGEYSATSRRSRKTLIDRDITPRWARLRSCAARISAWQIAFYLLLVLFAGLSIWTLDLYPTVWFDEVEIVSAASSAFPGPPSPGTLEVSDGSRPTTFAWVHALVMRPFLAVFGLSPTASRLCSLVGGILAVILLRLVLMQLGIRPAIAAIVPLLLLTDVLFSGSLRSGRADTWAFVWVFAAMLLITKANSGRCSPALMAGAGVCAAASLMTWPTAALLMPLIAVPLTRTPGSRLPGVLARNLLFLGLSGGIVLAVAAVATFWPQPLERLLATQRAWSVSYTGLGLDRPTFLAQLIGQYLIQIWMPAMFTFGLYLAFRFAAWPALTAMGALSLTLIAVAASYPYPWRFLYALPSALIVLALGFEALLQYHERHGGTGIAKFFRVALLACLAGNLASSQGPWPLAVAVWGERAARDYAQVEAALKGMVQPGERVFGVNSAFYAVENSGAHLITRFHIVGTDGTLSAAYQANQVHSVDGTYQILDGEPAAIAFLHTIDVVVAPYLTAPATGLVSADRTIRFTKVAELPAFPHRGPRRRVGVAILLRRLSSRGLEERRGAASCSNWLPPSHRFRQPRPSNSRPIRACSTNRALAILLRLRRPSQSGPRFSQISPNRIQRFCLNCPSPTCLPMPGLAWPPPAPAPP